MMKKTTALLTLVLLMTVLVGCGSKIPDVDWTLKISGDVATPTEISFKELAAMEQVDLSEILMEKSTGEDEITSWSGPSLDAVLALAGAPDDFVSLTVFASDGYSIEITKEELTNGIVALKDSGEWIIEVTPDKGPIRLVTPETPANRWVFSVVEIQVNQ